MEHSQAKHIEIKYHFIREEVTENKVKVGYVRSFANVADLFTKALGTHSIENLTTMMG